MRRYPVRLSLPVLLAPLAPLRPLRRRRRLPAATSAAGIELSVSGLEADEQERAEAAKENE